jgi:hypothetical protein
MSLDRKNTVMRAVRGADLKPYVTCLAEIDQQRLPVVSPSYKTSGVQLSPRTKTCTATYVF